MSVAFNEDAEAQQKIYAHWTQAIKNIDLPESMEGKMILSTDTSFRFLVDGIICSLYESLDESQTPYPTEACAWIRERWGSLPEYARNLVREGISCRVGDGWPFVQVADVLKTL